MTGHLLQDDAPETAQAAMRRQYAALCWRVRRDKTQVLLVTSRETRRWITPKGWPIDGLSPAETAAREAWEEAGVTGQVGSCSIGFFTYGKIIAAARIISCFCAVYPLRVRDMVDTFPEKGQRDREWFTPRKAATRVAEPELAALIRNFDPRALKR